MAWSPNSHIHPDHSILNWFSTQIDLNIYKKWFKLHFDTKMKHAEQVFSAVDVMLVFLYALCVISANSIIAFRVVISTREQLPFCFHVNCSRQAKTVRHLASLNEKKEKFLALVHSHRSAEQDNFHVTHILRGKTKWKETKRTQPLNIQQSNFSYMTEQYKYGNVSPYLTLFTCCLFHTSV